MFPSLLAKEALELVPGIVGNVVRRDAAVFMPRIVLPAMEADVAMIGGRTLEGLGRFKPPFTPKPLLDKIV